jgi:hypothetical protein
MTVLGGNLAKTCFSPVKSQLRRGLAHLTPAAKVLLLVAITAAPLFGQMSYYGAIRGIIRDPSGALIPNAAVTLTNELENVTRKTSTDPAGEYVFADVVPSTYTIGVEVAGFKKLDRMGVIVGTAARIALDFTLEVGAVTQSVEVTAAAPLIETASATESEGVNTQQLADLPNIGRNALYDAKLTENVLFYGNPIMNRMCDQSSTANVTMGGSIGWVGSWLIDGIPVQDWDGRSVIIPSIEAVQEVKVLTNTYDAETGRNGGFVMNTILKSGSNDIHGDVFGAIRRNGMSANAFFNNAVPGPPVPLPPEANNLWAGNIGGPLYLGHLYNGKNRTWWFYAYEGSDNSEPYSSEFFVPTAAEVAGDFTGVVSASGQPIILYDPTTTNLSTGQRQTFLSEYGKNAVPPSMINPIGAAIASHYAAPAFAPTYYGQPDITASSPALEKEQQHTVKVDEQFTSWWRASLSYMHCMTLEPGPDYFGGPAASDGWYLWRKEDVTSINNMITLSPTTVLAVRYGFNRFPNLFYTASEVAGYNPANLGFPASYTSQLQGYMYPIISLSTVLAGDSQDNANNNYYNLYSNNISAMLSHSRGRHSLKFGFDFRRMVVEGKDYSYESGQFSFNGVFTQSAAASPLPNTGADLADLLLGYPASGQVERSVALTDFVHYYGVFGQDDIRVTPRLTLNLGLRAEHEPGFSEIQNRLYTGFDESAINPEGAYLNTTNNPMGIVPRGVIQWAGQLGAPTSVAHPETLKLGPRLGAAYQLDNKTVLRGGYGVMWGAVSIIGGTFAPNGFTTYTPYVASINGNETPYTSLSNPFPNGILQPVGLAAGSFTGMGLNDDIWSPNGKAIRVQQYSVDIERQLPGGVAVKLAYMGTKGANLPWDMNQNVLNPSYFSPSGANMSYAQLTAPVNNPFYNTPGGKGVIGTPTVPLYQLLLPFPTYGYVTFGQSPLNKSTYNSMVVAAQKRMGQGLTFLTNVTWMKSYDYSSSASNLMGGASGVQNPFNLAAERSLSQFAAPLLWNLSFTYQLPVGKGKPFLGSNKAADYTLGGWSLNGTWIIRSGFPTAITQANNYNSAFGYAGQRPTATGIPSATSGSLEARLGGYINPAAFTVTPALQFGNVQRLVPMRGPGYNNADIALFKTVTFAERYEVQVRAEAFNAFNTPLFYGPNATVGSGGFGTITSQANIGRQFQLGLRFKW